VNRKMAKPEQHS